MNQDLEPYQAPATPAPRRQGRVTRKMALLETLRECATNGDTEGAHMEADEALLKFINDPEISAAFEEVPRWYA